MARKVKTFVEDEKGIPDLEERVRSFTKNIKNDKLLGSAWGIIMAENVEAIFSPPTMRTGNKVKIT